MMPGAVAFRQVAEAAMTRHPEDPGPGSPVSRRTTTGSELTGSRRLVFLLVGFVALVAAGTPAQSGKVVVLDDFDGNRKISVGWRALGEIHVRRIAADRESGVSGVEGKMVEVVAKGRGTFLSTKAKLPPLERIDRVVFRARAPGAAAERPAVFEFLFTTKQERAWFWRKVTLVGAGWQEVSLPLRFFRWSAGTVPRWDEVIQYGFHLRGAGTIVIDRVEAIEGEKGGDTAYLSPGRLARLAFGEAPVRTLARGQFVILTDAAHLDLEVVHRALAEMAARVRNDFPHGSSRWGPVPLLVFAEEADYRSFWPRFAGMMGSRANAPRADGFTSQGIASSSVSRSGRPVRPVFVHEACHALCTQILGLPNRGEWLQEALATRYQLMFSGQSIRQIVQEGIEKRSYRLPLERLVDGSRIPTNRYWQAATFLEWLLDDAKRRKKLDEALADMRARASTDLRPLAATRFGMSIEEMESAWLAWSAERYGRSSGR
jgi:hypothetical protein